MLSGRRIYVNGPQRLALVTVLHDVIEIEGGNENLEAVLRKLDDGPPPVIEGQTDIDEMLADHGTT